MTDLPTPPIDAAADLRSFPHMPLDVVRLRDSGQARGDLAALGLAVLTWCVAWHQVPAGSLPDDDAEMAWLLGFGRDVAAWQALKERGALRGWTKCSDGRLYHPVVVEKALVAWKVRCDRIDASRLGNAAKREKRLRSHVGSQMGSHGSSVQSPLPSRDVRYSEPTTDVSGDTRAREAAAGAPGRAGATSAPDPTAGTPGDRSPASAVPSAAIADPNDLTTALPALDARPHLRVVENRAPAVTPLHRLTFAGARIGRDESGVWLLAVEQYGIDRVLAAIAKIIAGSGTPWWSTVKAWLDGGDAAAARPNDGWHYPRNVKFDAEGPHIIDADGVRHRFRPTKKLADMQREGGSRG